MAVFRIPSPMRGSTDGRDTVTVQGSTVRECLMALQAECPKLAGKVLKPEGDVSRFVNVFVGEEMVRTEDELAAAVGPSTEISLVTAIAGG